jgi:branched-chain amino acid transport system substrate-binding protein
MEIVMRAKKGIARRDLIRGIAGLAAASAAGAVTAPAIAQNSSLKVGIIAARAGTAAYIGENGLRATEWAVGKINAAGGIAGRKVELVVEEETNAKETLERARRLVLQEKVECIQGVYSTGVSLPMAPTLEDMQALTIFWDGTTQDGVKETLPSPKFVFKSTDNECEAVMASILAARHLKGKYKRIAVVSPDYSYGRNVWTAFKALNKKFGIEAEVVAEQWSSFSQIDFTSNVAALKAEKPDLIFCVLGNADLPIFMRATTSAGLTESTKMVLVQAGHQHGQLKKSFTPEGTLLCYNTMYFARPNPSPAHKEFVDYYMDRFKDYPHWECDRAYFAMNLYKAGVEKAVAAKGGRWPGAAEVAAAMEGIKTESFGGPASMRKDHIAEQVFYGGFATHENSFDICTLKEPYSFDTSVLQKPSGADFWQWLDTAKFPV